MISIFLNVSSLVLWPNTWLILPNVLCTLEKNMYSGVAAWSILYISVRFSWLLVLFL